MSDPKGRQYPYRAVKLAAKFARLCWRMGRPLGRPTRARACFDGSKAVGFDLGLDCVVTCLRCGYAFHVGTTLSRADSDTPWLPHNFCKQPGIWHFGPEDS